MTDFLITSYGASPSLNDNQTQIQAAINACVAAGGSPNHRVVVPVGMFRHSGVFMLEFCSMVGTNSLSTRGAVSGLFASNIDKKSVRISQSTQARPVIVSDLYLTGVASSRQPATNEKAAILVSRRLDSQPHPSYWVIRNNFVEGPNQDPDADDTTPNMAGFFIYGGTNGLIERNTLRFTSADSIHVTRGSASQNILVQYNLIEYPGDDSTAFVTYGSSTSTAVQACVSNCTSQYNTSLNSRNGRCFTSIGTVNCKILYNYGENTSKVVPKNNGGKAGIMIAAEQAYSTPGSRNLLVKGNTLKETGGLGTGHGAIHLYTSGFTFASKPNWVHQNVVIEDNQIISSRRDAFVVNGTDGGTDVIIRNNQTYALPSGEENVSLQPSTIIRRGFVNTNNTTGASSTFPGNRAIKGIGGAYTTARHPTDGGVIVVPPPDPDPPPVSDVVKTGTATAGRSIINFSSASSRVIVRLHKVSGTAAITNFSCVVEPAPVWEVEGPGVVTFTQTELNIAGVGGTVPTKASRTLPSEFNKKYTLTFTVAGNSVNASVGVNGSMVPVANVPVGNASFTFAALYSALFTIERLAAGNATISNILLTKVADHVWEISGPGSVTVTTNENLTITATAASPATIAIRPVPTLSMREFIWSYTQTGAAIQRSIGITFGGSALSPITTSTAGNHAIKFYAQTSPLAHIRFFTNAVGTTTITNSVVTIVPLDNSLLWTLGAGTISQDAETQTVTITGNGTTATTARRTYNTVVGVNYRLLFEVSGATCVYQVGTTDGAADITIATTSPLGQAEVLFTAQSAITYLQVQRTAAGVSVITKPDVSVDTSLPEFFTSASPWNTKVPSGATFAAAAPAGLPALLSAFALTLTTWDPDTSPSVAIHRATASDPLRNILWKGDTWTPFNVTGIPRHGMTSAQQTSLLSGTSNLNTYPMNNYSTQQGNLVWNNGGAPADGTYTKWVQSSLLSVRIPDAALPQTDGDGYTVIIQPDGTALEMYSPFKLNDGRWLSQMFTLTNSLTGNGLGTENGRRASMIPCYAGAITQKDLENGIIRHALAMNIPASMQAVSFTSPAFAIDSNHGYSGTQPMGIRWAVPPSVSIASLGLTTAFGAILAQCLKDYGVILVDRGGSGVTVTAQRYTNRAELNTYNFGVQEDLIKIFTAIRQVAPGTVTPA